MSDPLSTTTKSRQGGRRHRGPKPESYFAGRNQTWRAGRGAVAERAHVAQRGVQAAAPRRRGAAADPDEGARAAAALARHRPGVGRAADASETTARAQAARGLGRKPVLAARPSTRVGRRFADAVAQGRARARAGRRGPARWRRRRRTRRCPAPERARSRHGSADRPKLARGARHGRAISLGIRRSRHMTVILGHRCCRGSRRWPGCSGRRCSP